MTLGTMFCLFAGLLAISIILGIIGTICLFTSHKIVSNPKIIVITGLLATIFGHIGFWGSLITGVLWLMIHFGVIDTHKTVAPQTAADTISH